MNKSTSAPRATTAAVPDKQLGDREASGPNCNENRAQDSGRKIVRLGRVTIGAVLWTLWVEECSPRPSCD